MSEKAPNGSLIPDESGEGKEKIQNPAVIVENRLDDPLELEGQNGPIVCGTDEGYEYKKKVNEDAVVVAPRFNAFTVIDGIGSGQDSAAASRIFAETCVEYFDDSNDDFEALQKSASESMVQSAVVGEQDGVCYLTGVINKDGKLKAAQAGDVRLIVVEANQATVRFATGDETMGQALRDAGVDIGSKYDNVVTNSVSGAAAGSTTLSEVQLTEGDRIIAASDGLWDNFSTEEVVKLVKGLSAREAMKVLEEKTQERMKGKASGGPGKPDHRSILIYDFEKKSSSSA